MPKSLPEGIPQIIAIVSVSREGVISLKKLVRDYLGAGDGTLYLESESEVLLTPRPSSAGKPVQISKNRLRLPDDVLTKLELERGSLVAMVQRAGAVALKRLEVEEREGDGDKAQKARWSGTRTAYVDFVNKTMNSRPEDRPTYTEALRHPFLSDSLLSGAEAQAAVKALAAL